MDSVSGGFDREDSASTIETIGGRYTCNLSKYLSHVYNENYFIF